MSIDSKVKRTSNIPKFSILENQEFFPTRDILQAFDCSLPKVVNDVGMSLQYANGVSHVLCEAKEGRSGMDVGGNAKVRLLNDAKVKEVYG